MPTTDSTARASTTQASTDRASTDQGPGTKRRLLDAAAELFARRGFRDVAVRDICEQACANVAAVNYHFGSKEKLHQAALEHARQRALHEDPSPAGPKPKGPLSPKQKLERHLRALLSRAFATGAAGWYMQMVLREMVDPTPALTQTIRENIAPHQRKLEGIIGQVMGEDPDSERVKDVASSVLATAVYYHSCRPIVEHMRPGFEFNQGTAERLTGVISAMVVDGVGRSA